MQCVIYCLAFSEITHYIILNFWFLLTILIFSFFLEKGIQSYFLSIIEQPKCGTYVCTQLLQTLNILFENIRNETSICEFLIT